ncbi:manganese transport protein [Robbsia andropogonis]|nr:Nramp family divalent metal transporter [Robbsia andropogonis]
MNHDVVNEPASGARAICVLGHAGAAGCVDDANVEGQPAMDGTDSTAHSHAGSGVTAVPTRWIRFVGAGAMIAVGYMDPGNWATDLAAGAQFGYTLLSVVLLASVAAMLLQWTASRVGLVTGRDLAQLCRERFGPRTARYLWITSEVAIIACDVAEVVGSAVALQLLLGVSLTVGVVLCAVGTIALLGLKRFGSRAIEIVVTALILFVGASFAAQLAVAHPDWHAVAQGLVPTADLVRHAGMLWLAAGILGATVMPHNLYLHSALVKHYAHADHGVGHVATACAREQDTARRNRVTGIFIRGYRAAMTGEALPREPISPGAPALIDRALRTVGFDTFASLTFAFLINAALLILAASVFHAAGWTQVDDLGDAHRLLSPLVGNGWSATLFASALLACGLNSTVTGTLAGQVVMEGFMRWRLRDWQRTLLTRALALGPALWAVAWFGPQGSNRLLVASQVVLSMQLPLAVIPLMIFAQNRQLMGQWAVRGIRGWVNWAITAAILMLNGMLILQFLQ